MRLGRRVVWRLLAENVIEVGPWGLIGVARLKVAAVRKGVIGTEPRVALRKKWGR